MKQHCRCRIEDWGVLLRAIGWSTGDAMQRLAVSRRTVVRLKHGGHYCAQAATERLMRIYLQSPDLQRRLAEAGVRDPWPEDRKG